MLSPLNPKPLPPPPSPREAAGNVVYALSVHEEQLCEICKDLKELKQLVEASINLSLTGYFEVPFKLGESTDFLLP